MADCKHERQQEVRVCTLKRDATFPIVRVQCLDCEEILASTLDR